MNLLGRILVEKRVALVPVVVAIVANLAVYGFWLYPLQTRVATGESRVQGAEQARRAAERDLADARATEVGKQRADRDLKTFYHEVLPADFARARQAAYVRVSQLASDANLKYERQTAEELRDTKDTHLARLQMIVVLEGSYDDVRKFIHTLETAPEFLIVDNVTLAQRSDVNGPLLLTLSLSTYYWTGGNDI